jgi:Glutaredoxin
MCQSPLGVRQPAVTGSAALPSVCDTHAAMSTREEVVVYTARTCPYCVRAERLLKRKGVDYERVAIWRFVPGGRRALTELVALDRSGRLDALLDR